MADNTGIGWTEATWNPIVGCSIVSKGCTNCYAMGEAGGRMAGTEKYAGLTMPSKAGPVWNGQVRLWERVMDQPRQWQRPRLIFVNSMGDVFHEAVPEEWICRVYDTMVDARHHTYQVLTKRPERMRAFLEKYRHTYAAWPHIWHGTSVEDQATADERIPILLRAPALVRWISAEPLLGAINLNALFFAGSPDGERMLLNALTGDLSNLDRDTSSREGRLHWVVVGGESGKSARPMHPDWARKMIGDCYGNGVPVFFKQWGEWGVAVDIEKDDPDGRLDYGGKLHDNSETVRWLNLAGGRGFHGERVHVMERRGTRVTGDMIDGRQWQEYPTMAARGLLGAV